MMWTTRAVIADVISKASLLSTATKKDIFTVSSLTSIGETEIRDRGFGFVRSSDY
jgi:hypothetical protein